MDEEDRNKILLNLTRLVEGISFDDLFNQLRSRRMFNEYMENEIMTKEGTKKLKFLYWYVTTRGPDAFNQLVEALRETNHRDLAALLTSHRPSRVHPFQNGEASSQLSLEEEYPYDEEWTVVRGDPVRDVFDYDLNKVYKMRSSPRGLALVINIRNYVNNTMEEREGSEKDVARLQSILPQLGYEVIVEENLSGDGMRQKVYEFSQHTKHWLYDSAMVFIMSHGRDRQDGSKTVVIAGSDVSLVTCYEVVNMLSAGLCEALRGKPKIFFFQTCRGNNFNHPVKVSSQNGARVQNESPEVEVEGLSNGVREENESTEAEWLSNGDSVDVPEGRQTLQTDGVMVGRTDVVRSDSDIFIGHATSPGMLSMRDPETGSWYIQTLCRVFARHAWHEDLHTMLQTVMQERNRLGFSDDLDIEATNQGFNKFLYFQPGICFDPSPIKMLNGS